MIHTEDKILIRNLKIFAYHGVNPEEKEFGQNFLFDIDVWLDISKPCMTDDVDDTVSYAKIIKAVRRIVTKEKYDLIERVAQVTADGLFEEFEPINKIKITLKKPDAPIKAEFDWVGVEIERTRGESR